MPHEPVDFPTEFLLDENQDPRPTKGVELVPEFNVVRDLLGGINTAIEAERDALKLETSLQQRILDGTRDRVTSPAFRGDIAENTSVTGSDIFGYFRVETGIIQPTTWAEILGHIGVSVNTLRDLTDFELGRLRRDLYNQFPGTGFALTPDRVTTLDGLPDTSLGGGGGGGRAGPVAPVYIPQDPAALRENIRNYVVATTGTLNASIVDSGVAAFGAADKQRFNERETSNIDPWQAMKETIRGTTEYKSIHQLRPESVDEMDWVVGRQAKLRQLGLSAERAETFGIAAATVGATNEALTGQAQIAQQQGTGRLLGAHRDSLKRRASAVLGLI